MCRRAPSHDGCPAPRCAAIDTVTPPVARAPARRRRLPGALGALLLFAVLAVLHTWPLASAPARLSRNDNADTVLNTWAIAWVAHALVHTPRHLLDGNIFHPERHTLAFSEPVIVPGVLSVPVRALGASPVLSYNLSLLLGYVLSAWAMQWLAWRWTGNYAASLVAGALFAFNAHTLTRMGHIQAIHAYGLPLLLLALDDLLRPDGRRLAQGVLLGLAVATLALTSGYLTIFGIVCGLVTVLVRPRDLVRGSTRRMVWAGLMAALVGGVLIAPVLQGYLAVRREHGFARSLGEVAAMSANGAAYLATPARIHAGWAGDVYARRQPHDSLFPGVVAVLLAVAGVALWRDRWRDPRLRTAVVIALAGVVLSFGPATPFYPVFHATVPFAGGIRAASRFGMLWLTGLSLLAAYGLAAAAGRWPWAGRRLAAAALIVVTAESFRGPVPYVPAVEPSPVYTTLAALPDGVVAEMPFWWAPLDLPRNAPYMLASTRHWKPLLNGYSGFTPASYRRHADVLWYFPNWPSSFAELERAGVRYVVVHLDQYGSSRADALALIRASPSLRLVAAVDQIHLYELVR